jgi:hypothetical protein
MAQPETERTLDLITKRGVREEDWVEGRTYRIVARLTLKPLFVFYEHNVDWFSTKSVHEPTAILSVNRQ